MGCSAAALSSSEDRFEYGSGHVLITAEGHGTACAQRISLVLAVEYVSIDKLISSMFSRAREWWFEGHLVAAAQQVRVQWRIQWQRVNRYRAMRDLGKRSQFDRESCFSSAVSLMAICTHLKPFLLPLNSDFVLCDAATAETRFFTVLLLWHLSSWIIRCGSEPGKGGN